MGVRGSEAPQQDTPLCFEKHFRCQSTSEFGFRRGSSSGNAKSRGISDRDRRAYQCHGPAAAVACRGDETGALQQQQSHAVSGNAARARNENSSHGARPASVESREELRGSRLREQELRREQQITQQQMRQAADATSTPSKAEGGGPVLKEKPKGQRRLGLTVQGRSFSSKPNVIAFKNFYVGKIYKLKVVLTNVSYTSNFCRYKGMSEHLEDYVSVRFKPPGQMSAGMSFELMVTFEVTVSASSHTGRASDGAQEQSALGVSIAPRKNEDLNGELQFAAQSGPFTVPVQCTTKKCDVTVDRSKIDFGTHVVGETIRRTFTLVNRGALGTRFRFVKAENEEAQENSSKSVSFTFKTRFGFLSSASSSLRQAARFWSSVGHCLHGEPGPASWPFSMV
ncbi:unnamed protein product [Lampetra fluviatilis]